MVRALRDSAEERFIMKITQHISMSLVALCLVASAFGQQERPPRRDGDGPPPGFGPGGGGPSPFGQQPEIKLLKKFDKDGDKFLTGDERKAALDHLKEERANRPRGGPRRFGGEDEEPAQAGKKISP